MIPMMPITNIWAHHQFPRISLNKDCLKHHRFNLSYHKCVILIENHRILWRLFKASRVQIVVYIHIFHSVFASCCSYTKTIYWRTGILYHHYGFLRLYDVTEAICLGCQSFCMINIDKTTIFPDYQHIFSATHIRNKTITNEHFAKIKTPL